MSNKVIYYWEAIGMNENWLRRGFRLLMEVRMQLAVRKLRRGFGQLIQAIELLVSMID